MVQKLNIYFSFSCLNFSTRNWKNKEDYSFYSKFLLLQFARKSLQDSKRKSININHALIIIIFLFQYKIKYFKSFIRGIYFFFFIN